MNDIINVFISRAYFKNPRGMLDFVQFSDWSSKEREFSSVPVFQVTYLKNGDD